MANRPLSGYPIQVSEKIDLVIDHDGPASYVNTGTFNTSGEQLNASDFGLGGIEYIEIDGISSDGLNYVYPIPGATITGAVNLQPAPGPQQPGAAVQTVILHWYVLSTNVEVANTVNLSGKYVRMRIRGV
jgi:hypothetical protein